ncbi:MAG TPA: NADH-quinone oxidoreductase subunit L, partial [Cupriavidus sp.]|nr:NADH-quinone oxidoreductase subunit L [Cupriavidus sp.]
SSDLNHHDEEVSHDHHHGLAPGQKPHESPWVVTLPLVLLAIPSVIVGAIAIEPMLFGEFFKHGVAFKDVIFVGENHHAMEELKEAFHGWVPMAIHSLTTPVLWLAIAGVVLSWFFYMKRPDIPAAIKQRFSGLYKLLDNKYYMDAINEAVFARGARLLGTGLWKGGDQSFIDGLFVNGSARVVASFAAASRYLQSGYIYHYAFAMIIGMLVLLTLTITGVIGTK